MARRKAVDGEVNDGRQSVGVSRNTKKRLNEFAASIDASSLNEAIATLLDMNVPTRTDMLRLKIARLQKELDSAVRSASVTVAA